jgi:protein-L-isoaspartate(D-aspartate) O-methyltransferase
MLVGILGRPGKLAAQDRDPYRAARWKMVDEEIAREGITNKAVLDALRQVPRHLFVPPELRAKAYYDQSLPIGHKQTITPPFVVAYMTEVLEPRPADRVLEIGTGSGYQAAILATIVKEVYTIEIVEPLGREAARRLQELGYTNVRTRIGDGYQGWPEHAPFDKVIVTCSPEDVPQPLVDQLREGGRMIVPLGERYQQTFYLFEKRDGKLVKSKLVPTLFVPMTGISEGRRQARPDPANPRVLNGGFEQGTDGAPESWYYLRQAVQALDGAPEGKAYLAVTNRDPGRNAGAIQALALDGKRVRALRLSFQVKADEARPGSQAHEVPAVSIHFFDVDHRPLGEQVLGPWVGTFYWRPFAAEVRVPPQTYEAVLRIGLNGATGRLSVDDLRLTPRAR